MEVRQSSLASISYTELAMVLLLAARAAVEHQYVVDIAVRVPRGTIIDEQGVCGRHGSVVTKHRDMTLALLH